MSWSKNLPLITGWYWYRGGYHSKDTQMHPVVIHIEVPGRGLDYAIAWQPGRDYASPLTKNIFSGEWYGPIEPPR